MMIVCATNSKTLSALGDDILNGANRSLELLKAIENTIAALCYDQRYYEAFTSIARDAAASLRNASRVKQIDADGAIENKLLRGQQAAHQLYEKLIEKRQGALSDPQLADEDGVAEEYKRTIQVVAELHNTIDDLRLALGEYDADLSPHMEGKVFSSKESIETYLETL